MNLRPGQRLQSVTCATNVIVVRGGDGDIDLRCGGHPMVVVGETFEPQALDPSFASGTGMGKRFAADELELLCTKPGEGSLSIGDVVIEPKAAKALPSSD